MPDIFFRLVRRLAMWLAIASVPWLTQAAAMTGATATANPDEQVITIDSAHAVLEPDGAAPREGPVDLGRRWEADFPVQGGRAVYRIMLPPHAGTEPMALLFSRVGSQVHVQVNGSTVQRWGVLGDPRYDASKTAAMVVLPPALLYPDRANELCVEVTIQRQRLGGLSVLRYGPQAAVTSLYDAQRRWHDVPMLIFAASLAGLGLVAAFLWWRQRDALYAWFSVAAFLGMVRNIDRAWPDVPVAWPHLGALVAVCYVCHIVLICRFSLMVLGNVSRTMSRLINAVIVLEMVILVAAYELGFPRLATLAGVVLVPLGLVTFTVILREAIRGRRPTAWVLAAAVALAVAAGAHDIVMIRIAQASGLRITLSQHAMFAFVLIMAGLLAERYSRSVADYSALNADLSRRVDERERQLRDAFESLRAQQDEQAVSSERARIMREIHDGVGSQLVGLLNMVTRPGADPAVLQAQVQWALDEMRMAVDSLQPMHDDLVTVLATLRYRLQPRLEAAGIQVVWDVDELPALRQLLPHAVLQVQRILLEAFTNVLKHAQASQVIVRARWHDGEVPLAVLQITDNGVGLRADPDSITKGAQQRGHGIGNMRARAASIGAVLRVEQSAGAGVSVVLEWQVERASTPATRLGPLGPT